MDTSDPTAAEETQQQRHYADLDPSGQVDVAGIAGKLLDVVEAAAARLMTLDASAASTPPAPKKWSAVEIVGHLVDSAVNNHQRFIRAQYGGDLALSGYAQDFWVDVQGYAAAPWPELVDLWRLYNRHLARVIKRIPRNRLDVRCTIGSHDPVSLGFLIEDYVAHLEHHLAQIDRLVPE